MERLGFALPLNKLKLKYQVLVLIALAMLIFILFQVFYLYLLRADSSRRQREFMETSVDQMTSELESFHNDIRNIMNTLSYNDTVLRFRQAKSLGLRVMLSRDINLIIETVLISSQRMDTIFFTDLEHIVFGAYESSDFRVLREINQYLADHDMEMGAMHFFSLVNPVTGNPLNVCASKLPGLGGDRSFYTVILYNLDNIQVMMDRLSASGESCFSIFDGAGQLICDSGKPGKDKGMTSGGQAISSSTRRADGLGWTVTGTVPGYADTDSLDAPLRISLVTSSVFIILLLFLAVLIITGIIRPIEGIASFMKEYGKKEGNKHRLPVRGKNEIGLLSASTNTMLDDLRDMTDQIVQAQEKLFLSELATQQSELMALQIQMNPHFLYNTLDCVRSIALKYGVPEIVSISTAMAKILRYSIGDEHEVNVKDEIACITEYLNIIQIRHGNRYRFEIEIEDEIKTCRIPKMLLQPLVENAVFHGLEPTTEGSLLRVTGGILDGGHIHFYVENDGVTIPTGKLLETQAMLEDTGAGERDDFTGKYNIGLNNINKRIKLLYGSAYGLLIDRRTGGGTVVRVTLPGIRTPSPPAA